MKPTEILSREHRVIEQGLACLEALVARVYRKVNVDWAEAGELLSFFRDFADKCHHHKEEAHLFAALEQRGMAQDSGPVAVMLSEHDLGRVQVAGMAAALDAAAAEDEEARRRFVTHATSYVLLLRAHIMKEDNILFPMADRLLNETEQDRVVDEFNRVEEEEMGAGTHAKFHALIDALAEKFEVKVRQPLSAQEDMVSCGHQA